MAFGASPFGFGPIQIPGASEDDLRRLLQVAPFAARQMPPVSLAGGQPQIAMSEADTQRLERSTGMVPSPSRFSDDMATLFSRAPMGPAQGFGNSSGQPRDADEVQVPLPPRRPFGFGPVAPPSVDTSLRAGAPGAAITSRPPSSDADMPAQGAEPMQAQSSLVAAARGQTPSGSAQGGSFMDRWKALADTGIGDQLLAFSAGVLSKGGAQGFGQGFQNMQVAERQRALLGEHQFDRALKLRKAQQEEAGTNQTVELLTRNGYSPETAQAFVSAASAGNREALANALNRLSPKATEAPSGYTVDPQTGRASFIPGGPQDPSMKEAEAAAAARGTAAGKPAEDVTLSPGQVRISGDTGQPLASVPDRDKAMERASGVRKEIQGLPSYKNYTQALPIYQGMVETADRDSKASDLNLIYGLGKIMDPGSVVREGELQMARDTQGAADKLIGMYNSISGGARLSPQARQQLLQEAYGRINSYENAFSQDRRGYEGIVGRSGLHPDDVLPNFERAKPYQPRAKPNRAEIEAEMRRRGLMP